MRPSILIPVLFALAAALAACVPDTPSKPSAAGCTAEEMRTRKATTAACEAEFKALLDQAEADRRRNSQIPSSAPAPTRDRF
ncbi:hypothetical protein [Caulobacter segnis]|uniref:Lipoprotein n=1 Tax=Caulobacter segnis TaxID=88688 RepID=A0A2W5X417_9CAUL|nr:hypothetical protein [Caulobacter segnis]PZR35474.1 MAG: hypothetical protein DI526_06860 [Caulobacter segnis]